ncbi:MAG TPA: hypothetical protein PLN52_25810 [Opitutaceae bacterium]|nr:hypothetical protein [Opitutaceae bacterium]
MIHVLTPEQKIAEHPLLLQRVAALEAKLAWFQKQVFGGGKSEKLDVTQRQLDFAGVDQVRMAVGEKNREDHLRAQPKARTAANASGNLRACPRD